MKKIIEQEKQILFVDDEEINLELFKLSFSGTFNIFTANSARVGLEILRVNDIPIIITDYNMPEMNGLKFIEEIKQSSPDRVCIIVSGFTDNISRKNKDLVFGLIQKPWKKNQIHNLIKSGFENYYQQSNQLITTD